jgi:GNAT superfamily N-acetyltransferase
MPFCSIELAARIERAEATLIRDASRCSAARLATPPLVRELAGGFATCTEPGSPLCKVAGLGFHGPVEDAVWDEIERAYDARDVDVLVEIATLGDPSIAAQLTRRGYELVGFENVLGRGLPAENSTTGSETATAPDATRIAIEDLAAANEAEWLETVVTGFAHPDGQGVAASASYPREALERVIRDMARAEGFRRYVARIDGLPAGAASMRRSDGVAQLCGAATLPALRRRGVQSALFEFRLREAAAHGCDIAVMTTQPGSKSQQNAHKLGFELLYARAVLVLRRELEV